MIIEFGNAFAFAAYAALGLFVWLAAAGVAGTAWLLVTACAGCLWAASTALVPLAGEHGHLIAAVASVADVLRTASWLFVLLELLWWTRSISGAQRYRHPAVVALAALSLVSALAATGDGILAVLHAGKVDAMARLGFAVFGLLLIDNVLRQSDEAARWSGKHLLIGVGGFFCYDLFFFAQTIMLSEVDPMLLAARPLVDAATVPLVLISLARLRRCRHVSQRPATQALVVHTTTLLGAGIYLLCMALLGYLLKETSLAWGPAMQITLLFGALLLLATILASRQVQVWLRLTISRNYLPLMYDYRREWLRFIDTMSASGGGMGGGNLHERAIRAVADIFECTSGALFLHGRGGVFMLAQRWNWASAAGMVSLPDGLVARLLDDGKALDLGALGDDTLAHLEAVDRPWLVVPLATGDGILGAILLGRPRVPRRLTWEDEELLAVLSVQLGGYIAEQQAAQALAEAKRFEQVNKGVTFIAHDLKNLVSQLCLIVQHADRHADDPEFRRDLIATVRHSVEKMRLMLQRINEQRADGARAGGVVDLCALVRGTIDIKRALFPTVTIETMDGRLPVHVEPLGFSAVIENLLQNAFEAAGPGVPVRIRCVRAGPCALLEIRDEGPGMTESFVRSRLHTPFVSGKPGGYGIGLYQSRDLVEQSGGRLAIDSRPGAGTTVQIELPLSETTDDASHDQHERADDHRTRSAADRR